MNIFKSYKITKEQIATMREFTKNILKYEDIEEKIQLNIGKGLDLNKIKIALEIELNIMERHVLSLKFELYNNILWPFFWRKYHRIILTNEIQAQNLREQLIYLNHRIKKEGQK